MGTRVEGICRSHRGGPQARAIFTPSMHDLALGEAWEKSSARTRSRTDPKMVTRVRKIDQ
jgi:hypothetical protein